MSYERKDYNISLNFYLAGTKSDFSNPLPTGTKSCLHIHAV